jgi:hypothetical protein
MKNNGDREFITFLIFLSLAILSGMIYMIYSFFTQSQIGIK